MPTHWLKFPARFRLLLVTALAALPCIPIGRAAEPTGDPGKLIVHEWGTFTSFSGSTGAQLEFHPLLNEDLPRFVYDRAMQAGVPVFTKARILSRIRMETPVTYFYTDRERTVRARVDFPKGVLTEFYPPVVSMAPAYSASLNSEAGRSKSHLDWGEIRLIPPASLAPHVADPIARDWLQQQVTRTILPTDGSDGNHYYHARATDSAFVHVHRPARKAKDADSSEVPAQNWIEKFLFYRGVGQFDQPLRVEMNSDGQVRALNPGKKAIRSLICLKINQGEIRGAALDSLEPAASAEFPRELTAMTRDDVSQLMIKALVAERLYPREAQAMVNTWADSWFTEEGTRVFYIVPRETTDALLPLTITPTPDETVRVLVGRVECLPPEVEQWLLKLITQNAQKREQLNKANAERGTQDRLPVPPDLIRLGRRAEPGLVRVRELVPEARLGYEAEILRGELIRALDVETKESN